MVIGRSPSLRLDSYFFLVKNSWHIVVRQMNILPNSAKSTRLSWLVSRSLKMRSTAALSGAFCMPEEWKVSVNTHYSVLYVIILGPSFLLFSSHRSWTKKSTVYQERSPSSPYSAPQNRRTVSQCGDPVGCAGLRQKGQRSLTPTSSPSSFCSNSFSSALVRVVGSPSLPEYLQKVAMTRDIAFCMSDMVIAV